MGLMLNLKPLAPLYILLFQGLILVVSKSPIPFENYESAK